MQTIGFLLPALGIGLLGYILNDWKLSVAIMTIGYGFSGATYSGHTLVNIYVLGISWIKFEIWQCLNIEYLYKWRSKTGNLVIFSENLLVQLDK